MTHERDFDRLAKAWLDLGPDEAPDRVVAAVLHAAKTTPQVRRHFGLAIWRSFAMNRVALAVGAVAVLAVVVIGGAPLLTQRHQPLVGGPPTSPSVTPGASLEAAPTPSAPPPLAASIVLQRSPANLGCDAVDPGWRSVTVHIDPQSNVYLEIVNPAFDGTKDRLNVDVWAEVDPLPSGSPETQPVEPLPPGTRLAVYWPADFTATSGDTPVILGRRGEEVARDGTRIDQEFTKRTGYVTCGTRGGLYVLEQAPG
jgi:hypothetical protein